MKKTQHLFFSQRSLAVVAFLAMAAFPTGCATVVDNSTAGLVVYVRGELQSNVDRRFEVVERAANRAITDLQFSNIEEKKDALVAIISARTADDARVHVKVERSSDKITTIRIRVDLIGNEKLSQIILGKIKDGL
jgi:hypothetical protein